MSVCRSARCLFSKATTGLPKSAPAPATRSFQTTAPRPARRRRPHYPSIKAEELQLLNKAAEATYPKYDTTETTLLEKRYTPDQIAAIKAAETAIDTRDILTQGQRRSDPWLLPYKDDLAEMDPVTDHAEKLSHKDIQGSKTFRYTNPVERDEAITQVAMEQLAKLYPDGVPEELSAEAQADLEDMVGTAMTQAAFDPRAIYTSKNPKAMATMADPRHSIVQPDLPRIENRMMRQTTRLANEEKEDPREKQLLQYMRWTKKQLRGLTIKTLVVHGVVNQTRMGKIRSMYFLTIAGNGNGLLGVGEGKSVEPADGRKQSVMSAIRNMKAIPRYENRTIYGDLEKKVAATRVLLYSRPPGFGLRCQHLIFEMARAAGLQDLAARTPRSRNKMNVIKATWEALVNQKLPDEIARGRGKKLVDVRKVYYGGSVH
ncbi:37S ribosomal protein-like protein S5 [Aaosphaeria arxii CBS 175.79]|uniref:Small ribosomal subunit protein uS5m n=1 Tax=Aaosphaeria arxii CBS 175.79 TaxID=1450172 RepID=A0A6A5Y236_9PLEO|nr:37S ribosomal protein-like protein S5 [Aaosphaeria arxii CBS 175.79]KAF2018890.1 37S ribosomal protein-like protein S5 [Aaosphaeria arxii CBS 175.79]